MLELFLGLVLGALLMFGVYSRFSRRKSRSATLKQSSVLLEKIRAVAKLITVEGDFAEIFRYENQKEHFGRLFSSKKKALIIVKARAHVGYDFKKLDIEADPERKTVVLRNFPQPEILSVEPELEFYDIRDGIFNRFNPEDLTALNREAKEHIRDKIPASGLMEAARQEALEAIMVMENIVGIIGWTLDYEALKTGVSYPDKTLNPTQGSRQDPLLKQNNP